MIKVNCYKTTPEDLVKTFCQLAEKSYYSDLKVCSITQSDEMTKNCDTALWTYSKKHFIPHGTQFDPYPDSQPVYITNLIEKLPKSDVIIFLNPSEKILLEVLGMYNQENLTCLQKILLISDDTQKIQNQRIINIFEKSYFKNSSVNFFVKNNSGNWEGEKM